MLRTALAIGLLATVLASAASVAVGHVPVSVKYDWEGPEGMLSVRGAEGLVLEVTDAHGAIVHVGPVFGDDFQVPCHNSGPNRFAEILKVRVGPSSFTVMLTDDDDWIWE